MVNVSVDLAPAQLKFLEKLLENGEFRSRSEAVRDLVRRAEFEWEWRKAIEECKNKVVDIDAQKVEKENK